MPDSIRKRIMDAVITRLKTIKTATVLPANAYQTNIGNNIFQERAANYNLADIAAPGAFNVFFPKEVDSNAVTSHQDHEMTVEVYGQITGDDSPTTCEQLIADLTLCIGQDVRWGGIARDTLPGEFEKDVDQDTKKIAGFKRTFTIRYRTGRFNPYTQP